MATLKVSKRQSESYAASRIQQARLSQFHDGWFLGNFSPSLFQTPTFEVAYKYHAEGESWPTHYQETATEYNLLVRGELLINGRYFRQGDLFVIPPRLVTQPIFLSDCELVVVKVPSTPADKVIVP